MGNYHLRAELVYTNSSVMVEILNTYLNQTDSTSTTDQLIYNLLNHTTSLQSKASHVFNDIIPNNELYTFITPRNDIVELNFRLTLAYTIIYRKQWYTNLRGELNTAKDEIMIMLMGVNQTLTSIREQCNLGLSNFCTDILPLYMTHHSMLLTVFFDGEVRREEANVFYSYIAAAVQADYRITAARCVTDQYDFYMLVS